MVGEPKHISEFTSPFVEKMRAIGIEPPTDEEREEWNRRSEAEIAENLRRQLRESSGMTAREQALHSADDLSPSLWGVAKRASEALDAGEWLLLHGHTGTGKTWVGSALLNREIGAGRRVRSVHWVTTLREIRATYRPGAERGEADIMGQLEIAHLLMLDDLGSAGEDTAHSRRLLLQLIHERDRRDRQTIITSNLTAAALYGQLDPRTVSRLQARCRVIAMPNRDLRRDAGVRPRLSTIAKVAGNAASREQAGAAP